MADHPLLLQAPLVRALLDGRKMQTRRPVTPQTVTIDGPRCPCKHFAALDLSRAWVDRGPSPAGNPGPYLHAPMTHTLSNGETDETVHRVYPRVRVGDRLWVREAHGIATPHLYDGAAAVRYFADGAVHALVNEASNRADRSMSAGRQRPSIHMPKWAARIWLEVTGVRIERVEDISERDADAEGFDPVPVHGKDVLLPREQGGHWSARRPFLTTWRSIYGTTDGWCIAYDFTVLSTTGEPDAT